MSHRAGPGRLDFAARTSAQEQLFILSRAVQQSPNAILIARADGVIEFVNPSFCKLTGYSAEELVGEHPGQSLGQGVSAQYRGLRGVLREGRDWRGEVRGKRKDGATYWVHETITPINNAEGKISHYLIIRQDITQQKRDHRALEESEARFRQVAEMTGEWLWEQDPQGRYLYCSTAVKDILGYAPEEMVGRRYLDFVPEEERAKGLAEFPGLAEQGLGFCRLLNCYLHKDGHTVYTESTGAPLFDQRKRLTKWRGVDHNITARKHYEDELRLRQRAIEAASVGISIVDAAVPGFPIIYVNTALCKITGYSREEMIGRNLKMLQGPDTDPATVAVIVAALAQERKCEVVLKNYRKDGTPFWNGLLISPVRDEKGRLTHYIGVQTDVTERRRAEEQRHELEIAWQIQLSLLPKEPLSLPGVQVFGACVPASHVGGDYFDYFRVENFLDIAIADVAGHSVGSALIMAEARSSLKAEARRTRNGGEHGPGETLRVLNELLFEDLNRADSFISMFYLRYDPDSRRLRYASAGHNPPLLLRPDALACEPLDADGMILGVEKNVDFEEKSLLLAPGDRLLLYTDGIVEARDGAGEFFGTRRLCRLFTALRNQPPQQVVDALLSELSVFTAGAAYEDDVTLVVAQAL
ncbi:MAG: PAS domain S-box protein [Candidatus Methylumidiphilus sp.]